MGNKEKDIVVEMDIRTLPLMEKPCKTCPFKLDKDGKYQNIKLAETVTKRTLFNAQQICHGTESYSISGKRTYNNRCIGSFNHNAEIYTRMGLDINKIK